MSKVIGADAAKLAGLQIDTLQKARDGQITLKHWEWFNKLTKTERDRLSGVSKCLTSNRASNALSDLFDRQIQTLRDRGCPDQILATFIRQKGQVLAKASTMTFKENRIPFLPIIPFSSLNPSIQMSMVKNGNQTGFINLDANEISNVVSVPVQPYYIFDVEDGKDMLGRSVRKAIELIKDMNRSSLIAPEVISLGIQTVVLSKHFVDASGSHCKGGEGAPNLYLHGSQPELGWFYVDGSDERWGSASCGSRS
ncbi:MAG: DUF5701 family protein [Patescibacteria group bacterium]